MITRRLLCTAGKGHSHWPIDSFPKGSTLHTGANPNYFYLYLNCPSEDFRDFAFTIEPFGVIDSRWYMPMNSFENSNLFPLGEWCRSAKRIYFRRDHFEALRALWVEFYSVRHSLGVEA